MPLAATWFALSTLLAAGPDADSLERYSRRQFHMGVEFEIVLYGSDQRVADQAFAAGFARVAELERIMSDYDPESELSRLSAMAPTNKPVKVSEDLWTVLSQAQSLSERTNGAFDVTVGPLTKLWRRARRQKEPPSEKLLASARGAVGYMHLQLDPKHKTASLAKPQMRLDLGGIAKGYAADEALATIARLGIRRALVRASGDIAVGDPPPGETGWRVGIAPLDAEQAPTRFVSLANQAISTSGDSRQHLVVKGKRHSHIVDPRTGWGVEGRSSVSVIAPRGIQADSLASAISVLGPQGGLQLVEETPNAAALVVVEVEGRPQEHRSERYSELECR